MGKYRVTLPVAFEDGIVHQPGEVVELETKTAILYAHALIAVNEKAQAAPAKEGK
jgi:hypothetical protein